MHDLVIIGGSISGVAAAIYAVRRKLNFVLISKDIGGEVLLSGEIYNYPGIPGTDGVKMTEAFREQFKYYDMPVEEGVEVLGITQKDGVHVIAAKDGTGKEKTYKTKTVIVATGIHPRTLGIPGEAELRGKGITSCTVCDGPLFKGKVTVTIGAGNSALESAIMMAGIASKVYVLSNKAKSEGRGFPKGDAILVDKVLAAPNVEVIYEAATQEIKGENLVTGVTYKDKNGKPHDIAVQGVMVHIGFIPNSQFIDCVKKDMASQIVTDKLARTSCEGIFAAGDVTDIPFKQIAIAGGEGVTACLSAIDYLNKKK
ncbi:MAG: FAD-dependent oxidoreductase [Candidatus Magasanikbacteria bacterium]|nr:FAD-dependent oxidoreductase [Candidatus Magasanikbacteria bacterium]